VLAPLRVIYDNPPVNDDNAGIQGMAEESLVNIFKAGQTVPVKAHLLDCTGNDVTTTIASSVMVKLTIAEVFQSGSSMTTSNIVPAYTGLGDSGGILVLTGNKFQYNLNTSGYQPGTVSTQNKWFRMLVNVYYNNAPTISVGAEDASFESK
jgi:hypothetical protein